jgi:hypothetical protein
MLAVPRHRDLIVPGQSGEREHHPGCGAGVRSGDAALDETYDAVKPQRLRIGGDLQALRAQRSQDPGDAPTSAAAIPRLL